MSNVELREALEKLQQELKQTENLDDEARQRLQHLMADMHSILEQEEPSVAEYFQSFGDQLADGVQRYEISHPALTAAMQRLLEILSSAGI